MTVCSSSSKKLVPLVPGIPHPSGPPVSQGYPLASCTAPASSRRLSMRRLPRHSPRPFLLSMASAPGCGGGGLPIFSAPRVQDDYEMSVSRWETPSPICLLALSPSRHLMGKPRLSKAELSSPFTQIPFHLVLPLQLMGSFSMLQPQTLGGPLSLTPACICQQILLAVPQNIPRTGPLLSCPAPTPTQASAAAYLSSKCHQALCRPLQAPGGLGPQPCFLLSGFRPPPSLLPCSHHMAPAAPHPHAGWCLRTSAGGFFGAKGT